MKNKKIIFGIFLSAIVSICWQSLDGNELMSPCDAPLVGDHTGAPGETNCTACHPGTNNSGPATITFDVGGGINWYVPGQMYLCTVSIAQTSINKMGYACVALRNSNNTTTGTFALTMPTTTRLFSSGGRNYVSHNPCGADAPTIGSNLWTFNWTAPSTNVGTITLYIGALTTNHNHATSGDFAYTRTVTLAASATSVNEIEEFMLNLNIYPNPVSDFLNISYENSYEQTTVDLLDMVGKNVATLYAGRDPKGEVKKSFDIRNIAKGVYWLRISTGAMSVSRKTIII